MAALTASGTSKIMGLPFLERGYENLVEKLRILGAQVEVSGNPVKEEPEPVIPILVANQRTSKVEF
jgi:hypothetical protein